MYLIILWLFSVFIIDIHATTHWMVTETGLIQPTKIDSPFQLVQPHDLMGFLKQDILWYGIRDLYKDLSKRQVEVNLLWFNLEPYSYFSTLLSIDKDCKKAAPLKEVEWFPVHLVGGEHKIPRREFSLHTPMLSQDVDVPECKKPVPFSMLSFDHLESIGNRHKLSCEPERSLPSVVESMSIDQFGHWLASLLRQNTSSWLHYNMASLYWRVRGNGQKAIECSRRAIHYVHNRYKDIALLSMGSILHNCKKTEDAIIVLNEALDYDPHSHIIHLMLANAYAVNGDFESSLFHFNQCLKLKPGLDGCTRHSHAVLCNMSLLRKMRAMERDIEAYRALMKKFLNIHSRWLKMQTDLLKAMKQKEDFGDFEDAAKNSKRIAELTGIDMERFKSEVDKISARDKLFDMPDLYDRSWFNIRGVYMIDGLHNIEKLMKYIMKNADEASHSVFLEDKVTSLTEPEEGYETPEYRYTATENLNDIKTHSKYKNEFSEFHNYISLYPPTMKISRNVEDFDTDLNWPPDILCKVPAPGFPRNARAIFPVFLPFENKGIIFKTLLTDMIGVPGNVEHDLPWYPPTCPQDSEAAFSKKKTKIKVVATDYLRQKLLEYVGGGDVELVKNMQDSEIGHRIYTAIQMKLAKPWFLYTLASLYWRVRGNNVNALHCLLTANRSVRPRHKDIVCTSLSSVYLEMGYVEDALAAASESYKLSLYEPATNFVLAELSMISEQKNIHMFHLMQVVRVEPGFMGGLARNLINVWACIHKEADGYQDLFNNDAFMSSKISPSKLMKGGSKFEQMDNMECSQVSEDEVVPESSTIVRIIEESNVDNSAEYTRMFASFIENMPSDRGDRAGHYENYQVMMRIVNRDLEGCGSRACSTMTAEDLNLKDEDCRYQENQLTYWLSSIAFKHPLQAGLVFPPEISLMSSSNKGVPDCRLHFDTPDDFYLERMSKVDREDWQPLHNSMSLLSEVFGVFDYAALGARIAKYVERNPSSWQGLLGAGWWCGAGGFGECAVRCLSAAHALAPPARAAFALRTLAALLHMQSKHYDAKDIAYLSFYLSPKSQIDTFIAAVSHSYLGENEQAIWMFRYALSFDDNFQPAHACVHATICFMVYGENWRHNVN